MSIWQSFLELNPILTRESRARWRGRAFGLLFGGVALMAVIMVFAYENATQWVPGSVPRGDGAARMGAHLFMSLTYYQIVGWMLLSPALTATAIASEREQGLLEGLQLSSLSPGQIVRGKLYSTLTFIALLLLATQPIMAICFFLGGVSPQEFFGAFVSIFLTALAGSALGLCVSAWSRRASHAVGTTLGMMLFWSFGTSLAVPLLFWTKLRTIPGGPEAVLSFALLNPALARAIEQSPFMLPGAFTTLPLEPEAMSRVLLAIASALLLWLCVPAVRRPFREQFFVEVTPTTPVVDVMNIEAKSEATQPRRAKRKRDLWQISLANFIRSRNPVLQRDLRAKLVFRRVSPWVFGMQSLLILCLAIGYFALLRLAIQYPGDREGVWIALTGTLLFGLIIAPAVAGAGAITREREGGTWQSLRLSLLSPFDIVLGKQGATVAITILFLLLILPFSLLCALPGVYGRSISLPQMAMTILLWFATAWFSAAWGLLISYRCKKTAAATSWTIGSLFVLLAMMPPFVGWVLYETLGSTDAKMLSELLLSLHPFGAFYTIYEVDSNNYTAWKHNWWAMARGIVFLFWLGTALLWILFENLRSRAGRED